MENTNNVISIMDLINSQETTRRTRTSQFTEYSSKKKLFESQTLSAEKQEQINQIKNTFSFSLDKSHKYLIITLYNRNSDKKYSFFILNLDTMTGVAADSIKKAKETVLKLLGEKPEVVEEEVATTEQEEVKAEEVAEPVEAEEVKEEVESTEEVKEEAAEVVEKSAKRNRTRKTAK